MFATTTTRFLRSRPVALGKKALAFSNMARQSTLTSTHRACLVSGAAAVAAGAVLALASSDAESQGWSPFSGPAKGEEAPAGTVFKPGQGTLVLSGDCGGTNTRLVLFSSSGDALMGEKPKGVEVFAKKYLNAEHKSFTAVVQKFLQEAKAYTGGELPQACCLACAGGIRDNKVNFTNVDSGWEIDGDSLRKELNIPKVKLINDFEAQGYGLLTLSAGEKVKLNDAEPRAGAPIACVGAGTGLGECFLTCADGKYTCWPSEGGHAEFSPRSPIMVDLLAYLVAKFGHTRPSELDGNRPKRVSVERVVSGGGLSNIYEFLRQHWAFEELLTPALDANFLQAPPHKQGAIVAQGAAAGDMVCKKAVEIFSECYGSEVGVAALKWLPYGGLYVSGGIGAKNPQWVKSAHFMDAYQDKGRMSNLVMAVPLYLVNTEDTGERGALFCAIQLLK